VLRSSGTGGDKEIYWSLPRDSWVFNQNIDLEFTPFAVEYLVDQGFDPQFGARPLKRVIQKEIINLLSKKIIAGDIDKDKKVIVDVFDGMVVLRNK